MNVQVLIAVVASAAFSVGLPLLFDFLKARGINVEQAIAGVEEIADGTEKVVDALVTVSSAPKSEVKMICEGIKTAAVTADVDYKAAKSSNPTTADTRKATVTAQVQSLLAMSGIKATPEINKVISVAIDILVLGMHTTQTSTAA